MCDLARNNNVTTNGVNGRIGNKTKCECCAPLETNIEGVCCLEIPEICISVEIICFEHLHQGFLL